MPPPLARDSPRSPRLRWRVAFAVWTLLVASGTLSSALGWIAEGKPHPWARALAWNAPLFYLWMGLSLWVARLARATAGRGWRRALTVHLPAAVLASALQTSALLLIYGFFRGLQPDGGVRLGTLFREDFVYPFHLGLLTYGVLLVIVHALDARARLETERLRALELEGQLAHARLLALRTQLQPHFLFNTLNAISALTLADPPLARTLLTRLADLLRLTLEDRDATGVPLARERELLECYLGIQQVRFQDRLTVRLELPEDTLQAKVPQLLLQPLAENALQHGLLPKPGRGTLSIRARREGNALALAVEDDGLGLPDGELCEGVGLRNTRARLRALAGEGAGLLLIRRPEGGTRVEVRLPFEEHRP